MSDVRRIGVVLTDDSVDIVHADTGTMLVRLGYENAFLMAEFILKAREARAVETGRLN